MISESMNEQTLGNEPIYLSISLKLFGKTKKWKFSSEIGIEKTEACT